MNASTDATNQPELILKLCNHFAKNNPEISANLCKIAFSFLSTSSETIDNNVSDEVHLCFQIRETLNKRSKDDGERFDLLYSNLCKSNTLRNRCAILKLLYKLSSTSLSSKEVRWGTFESLDRFSSGNKIKSLRNSTSQDSIKSVFRGSATVKSARSNTTSTTTTNSQSSRVASDWVKRSSTETPSNSNVNFVNEKDILQDIIYSFQGIEGDYLKKETAGLGFVIDQKTNLNPTQKSLIERLLGTSFLHNQLKQYCDNNDKQNGIICQALIANLREELSSYYKTIAILQTALSQQDGSDTAQLTLRKTLVYIHDHHIRFEWLAYIAEQCNDKRGGALITSIHGFLQHGSKCTQEISQKVLTSVCKPLYIMLSRWLLDGDINDPYNEFFIELRNINTNKVERLWYDKYHVRKTMIPSFITLEQAKKILATGKSINFLRQICKDDGQLPGRDSLQKLFKFTQPDALFQPEQSIEFHSTLEKVYRETSLRVLDLLKDKYRLFEHLQSLRRYLLLGQGDFIRHLLELLVPELNKPANEIYIHTLSAILESAIRVTNAQYEDEDTLQRLNVSFMGFSKGDTGWDVFSLIYIVDGPVGTIFQPTIPTYQCLFGALWKAKRMEFVLANMRKQQISLAKIFRKIKELKPIMHSIHILTSEMIHFLHQTQYYFLFEVLECSWAEMIRKVNHAECLDDVINAHTTFLHSVETGVLLDENSRSLFSLLRLIYNVVLTLENHQNMLDNAARKEFEAYMKYRQKCESNSGFGTTHKDRIEAQTRIIAFHQFLNNMKTQVKNLAQTYQQFVKEYLKLLSSSSNMNLQLLSVRLNFNDYYKII